MLRKSDVANMATPMPDKGVQARLDNPIAREVSAHSGNTENKIQHLRNAGGVPKDNLGAKPKS
jgi:hypothetical protein